MKIVIALCLLILSGCYRDSSAPVVVRDGTMATASKKGLEEERKETQRVMQVAADHIATAKVALDADPEPTMWTDAAAIKVENAAAVLPEGKPDTEWLAQALSQSEEERKVAIAKAQGLTAEMQAMRAKYEAMLLEQRQREVDAQNERMEMESAMLAKIKQLELKAKKAQEDAENKLKLWFLRGLYSLSGLCLLGAMAILVIPMLLGAPFAFKRGMAAGVCFVAAGGFYASARIMSHPYFVPIFSVCFVLAVGGLFWWLFTREKEYKDVEDTLKLTTESVETLREQNPTAVKSFEDIAGRRMDRANKNIIRKIKTK